MGDQIILSLTFLMAGIVETIISIPLIFGKIQPNYLYGFIVKKTLSNKEIWYKANKYNGNDMLIAGLILAIGSLGFFVVEMDLMVAVAIGLLLLLLVPLTVMLVRAFMYLKTL